MYYVYGGGVLYKLIPLAANNNVRYYIGLIVVKLC